MNNVKIIAILLIVSGTLAVAFGGFSYNQVIHDADIGALHMEVNEKRRVNIPLWAGIAAIVGGSVLLLAMSKKE